MLQIPFALPDIGDEEISAVVSCMRSGWLTTGRIAKQFEDDFSAFFATKPQAISVNSATMGLLLALEAFGVGHGDEVIVPTYTFSATGMMPVHLGARPVFIDSVDPTYNLDPSKLEAAITSRTKAIIPVHFAGYPADMDVILAIAKKYNLRVLEDAAHTLPSTYHNRLIGDLESDATVFSFYATKTITTGEGGMILTKDDAVAKRCRVMRLHGISRDVFDRYTTVGGKKWNYEIVAPGSKCNLTDIAASIGVEQLKKANAFRARRAKIAEYYNQEFKDLPLVLPKQYSDDCMHSWHLYVVRTENRDELSDKLAAQGVGTSVHFIPLHLQLFYCDKFGYKRGDFPVAEQMFDASLSLPIYTKMSDNEVEYVVKCVKEAF